MEKYLSNAEMRAADKSTIDNGVSGEELMLRAGRAIADEAEKAARRFCSGVLVVCGTGNNGGDGYVCARELLSRGISVRVFALDGLLSADCAREKARYKGEYADEISGSVIVDCIFGTGLSRPVEGAFADAVNAINSSGAFVISADIPSGLNGDNGRVLGCAVRADLTVAVAEKKLGHVLGSGADCCGEVVKKDIGITASGEYALAPTEEDIKKFFPKRKLDTHKGSYGSANLLVGSEKFVGAACLALDAALRSGCGYVKLTCGEYLKNALVTAYPQVIYLSEPDFSADCIAVGSGCGKSEELYFQIKNILENYKGKLVLDADALNVLAERGTEILKDKSCEVLITPHVKEFSRLTKKSVEEILSDPVGLALSFAREHKITVLLKGHATVICDGVKTYVTARGDSSLSKGGSGDMLTGLICGSCARGLDLISGALASAFVLGKAAEITSSQVSAYCATAQDILKNLSASIKDLTI